MDWNSLWNGGSSLNLLEILLRVTILYFSILFMTRLMGPRQVGIVSAFNFYHPRWNGSCGYVADGQSGIFPHRSVNHYCGGLFAKSFTFMGRL